MQLIGAAAQMLLVHSVFFFSFFLWQLLTHHASPPKPDTPLLNTTSSTLLTVSGPVYTSVTCISDVHDWCVKSPSAANLRTTFKPKHCLHCKESSEHKLGLGSSRHVALKLMKRSTKNTFNAFIFFNLICEMFFYFDLSSVC